MSSKILTGLYWFRHDLRLTDNPTFNRLCDQVDWLICVYVRDQNKELQSQLCDGQISQNKLVFEHQSAVALDTSLRQKNQYLLFVDAPAHESIIGLVEQYSVTHIGIDGHPGVYEEKALVKLQKACSHVQFIVGKGNNLFSLDELPFELGYLSETFTPFRKQVEHLVIDAPVDALAIMPNAIAPVPQPPDVSISDDKIKGGESAGHKQLNQYLFATDLIKQYKQTRNALDDWDSSSKLSFWLANGCLSTKTVYHAIKQYEAQRGANDSTYWLYFELL